ncbi:MAG: S8 family serine peptidase [Promethearchaeota archaeon]
MIHQFQILKKRQSVSMTLITIFIITICANMPALIFSTPSFSSTPSEIFSSNFFGNPPPSSYSKPQYDQYQFLDPLLRSYLDTNEIPEDVRSYKNRIYFLMGATPEVDFNTLSEHMTVVQAAKLNGGYIIQGYVTSPKALRRVYSRPDVGVVIADRKTEFKKNEPEIIDKQFSTQKIMGADRVNNVTGKGEFSYPIDGTGITIGIVDSGTDFGVTDLSTAYAVDSSGYPTSFDGEGVGIAITNVSVSRTEEILPLNNYSYSIWVGDIASFLNSSLIFDSEDIYIGNASTGVPSLSGTFKVGIASAIASGMPYLLQFFLFILSDTTTSSVYDTLYIDWETSWNLTAKWNELSAGPIADWDFTNNLDDPHRWGDGTEVLATDFDKDGINDFSLGCLANTYDIFDIMTGGLVRGINDTGVGFAFINDYDGHGTSTAASAAGRGIIDYDVYGNGTMYKLPGIAPAAEVMAIRNIVPWGWLWGTGWDPIVSQEPNLNFLNWTYTGNHKADILSNSWGWIGFETFDFVWGYDWNSWFIDYLSSWNSTLILMAAGNDGPGYGTGFSPSSAGALTVGASTSFHIFEDVYDNNSYWEQGTDQIVSFSSGGPMPSGVPKPNIVAIGAGTFTVDALDYGQGDGSNAVGIFSGTSLACPLAAGVAALMFQAGLDCGVLPHTDTPGIVKAIMESTAIDLGYDPFRQGAGRVDAWRAVNAIYENATDGIDPLLIAYSTSSFDRVATKDDRSSGWLGYYMGLYNGTDYGFTPKQDLLNRRQSHPSEFGKSVGDDSLFTGSLFPGESQTTQMTVEVINSLTTADEGVAYELVLWNESSSILHSTSANTTWPLADNFDESFMNQWNNSDYAVIYLTYPKSAFENVYLNANDSNYVFLHDWNDLNNNNRIDFTSPLTSGEVRRVTSDTTSGNNHQLHVGKPGDAFYKTGSGSRGPTIYYRDVGAENELWPSLDVLVTIRLYQKIPWQQTPIDITYNALTTWNVTITIGTSTTPGVYGGFIEWTKGGVVAALTPVSVRVDGKAPPDLSLTWGGTDSHPYDNGVTYGAVNWYGQTPISGDWRFYYVDIDYFLNNGSDDFTTWVMTNVTWTDPETVIDVYVFMSGYGSMNYFGPYSATQSESENFDLTGRTDGTPTWSCQNVLFTDFTWDISGWWGWNTTGMNDLEWQHDNSTGSCGHLGYLGIALHTIEYGSMAAYENFSITVTSVSNSTLTSYRASGLQTIDDSWDPSLIGGYPPSPYQNISHNAIDGLMSNAPTAMVRSIDNDDAPVYSGSLWSGPHANFSGTFDVWSLSGFSTISIRDTEIRIELTDSITLEGLFTATNATPGDMPVRPTPSDLDYTYTWRGIIAGQRIKMELTVPDPPGVPGDPPHDLELVLITPSGKIYTSTEEGSEELISIKAPEDGNYIIGVDYWGIDASPYHVWGDWAGGLPFIVTAKASLVASQRSTGMSSVIDSHVLDQNAAFDIVVKGYTGTSLDWLPLVQYTVTDVTITNLFPPNVEVTYPNGGETVGADPINITWTANDPNIEDTLFFSVEVSNDSGQHWAIVTTRTKDTQVEWDPLSSHYGLNPSDQYLIRVNATDKIFETSDTSDAIFTFEYQPQKGLPVEFIILALTGIVIVGVTAAIIYWVRKRS